MSSNASPAYDDDFFKDSRMSFGDHLDELRWRMWSALKGMFLIVLLGFVLDGLGDSLNMPWLGIGKPALKIIIQPIEQQTREFYGRRATDIEDRLQKEIEADPGSLGPAVLMPVKIPTQLFLDTFKGLELKDPEQTEIEFKIKVFAKWFDVLAKKGETLNESRNYLTTLSVTEAFMVYMKVSLLCGFIVACPWIFYQFWAFVGAGLYPHEKKYVYYYLPFSIGMFLIGIAVCQFLVLPGAVKFLIGFNDWIGLDPDLRLSEWLGFAIMLPLIFGISFQTPLVMLFLARMGIFTWRDYWAKWRIALMVIAVFSAVATPTPDAVTMLYLFVPMFGLYCLGVFICQWVPERQREEEEPTDEIAV
jgi:sec-independent protein translocase protein TatC